jgi:two-component sensor histidine kinase
MHNFDKYTLHFTTTLCCLYLLLAQACNEAYGQPVKNEWLTSLIKEIGQSNIYDSKKNRVIDSLRLLTNRLSKEKLFEHYLKLHTEYAVFNFDSAYHYAARMEEVALEINDTVQAKYAAMKRNSVLLSTGMFKEVFESLGRLSPDGLNDHQMAEYYALKARSFFDLADYNRDSIFSIRYNTSGEQYVDSCISLSPSNSFFYKYYNGLKYLRNNDVRSAATHFSRLTGDSGLSLHEQAIVYSTFSDIFIRRRMPDSAIVLLAKAAIADIRSSTKETTAILHLATLLFKKRDLDNAAVFIQKAATDAKTYGARQRLLQLSNILPVIEAERFASIEEEKHGITRYAAIITILLTFLLMLVAIIIRQIRKMKNQQNEINRKNISLHRLVGEKEWLLKEVHHRVKNNLHTITSLLESQSAYLQDDALTAIKDSQHRVYAMSLVHQKLYQPEDNVTSIDMVTYVHELISYLKDSFQINDRFQFIINADAVILDISLAVPLGLILNEAITNAVKYAFESDQKGVITISIRKTTENKLQFTVTDNGKGLSPQFDINKTHTLGMKLMRGLCEDIGAAFLVESRKGTAITIAFKSSLSEPFHG